MTLSLWIVRLSNIAGSFSADLRLARLSIPLSIVGWTGPGGPQAPLWRVLTGGTSRLSGTERLRGILLSIAGTRGLLILSPSTLTIARETRIRQAMRVLDCISLSG